jgi:hypothetical protein
MCEFEDDEIGDDLRGARDGGDTVVPGETGDQPIRNPEAPVTEPHLA